jgi:hypothetical protein
VNISEYIVRKGSDDVANIEIHFEIDKNNIPKVTRCLRLCDEIGNGVGQRRIEE